MHGVILAAGAGTRLRPLTDDLPKTLLPVAGERTILDLAVGNIAAAGVEDVTIVTGHAAASVERAAPALETRHGVRLHLRHNDEYATRNNAYSLWLVRDLFPHGVLLVNGDTVHPASVEERLLASADGSRGVALAVDDVKALGEEEMKVELGTDGQVVQLTKQLPPDQAVAEYIGVAWISPRAAAGVEAGLWAAFDSDLNSYYEDGFQRYSTHGGDLTAVSVAPLDWVEVDDHADLDTARAVTTRW